MSMGLYEPGQPPPLSYSIFVLLRDLINRWCGIYFEDNKADLLADKLAGRLADLGIDSFDEYYRFLRYDPAGPEEWQPLTRAITINESYFLREVDQLRAWVDLALPEVRARHPRSDVTLWSAACAAGEEPYSLAILMLETGRAEEVRIIGSDVNGRVIDRARRGIYNERALRAMPLDLVERYFRRHPEGWEIDARVRDLVSFRQLNLLDEESMRQIRGMDTIFCRNVFIYFDPGSIQKVAGLFYASLHPGGYLFLGAAESLLRVTTLFELVEVGSAFAYRKGS